MFCTLHMTLTKCSHKWWLQIKVSPTYRYYPHWSTNKLQVTVLSYGTLELFAGILSSNKMVDDCKYPNVGQLVVTTKSLTEVESNTQSITEVELNTKPVIEAVLKYKIINKTFKPF